eukprot:327621_1
MSRSGSRSRSRSRSRDRSRNSSTSSDSTTKPIRTNKKYREPELQFLTSQILIHTTTTTIYSKFNETFPGTRSKSSVQQKYKKMIKAAQAIRNQSGSEDKSEQSQSQEFEDQEFEYQDVDRDEKQNHNGLNGIDGGLNGIDDFDGLPTATFDDIDGLPALPGPYDGFTLDNMSFSPSNVLSQPSNVLSQPTDAPYPNPVVPPLYSDHYSDPFMPVISTTTTSAPTAAPQPPVLHQPHIPPIPPIPPQYHRSHAPQNTRSDYDYNPNHITGPVPRHGTGRTASLNNAQLLGTMFMLMGQILGSHGLSSDFILEPDYYNCLESVCVQRTNENAEIVPQHVSLIPSILESFAECNVMSLLFGRTYQKEQFDDNQWYIGLIIFIVFFVLVGGWMRWSGKIDFKEMNTLQTGHIVKASGVWGIGVIAYVMMTERAPFRDDRAIFESSVLREVELSGHFKGFMGKTLITDYRLNRRVMHYPRQFPYQSKLKEITRMTEGPSQQVSRYFRRLNVDGDAFLDLEELTYMLLDMSYVGFDANDEAKKMIEHADKNKDGVVDFEEFKQVWDRKVLTTNDQYIHRVFDVLDDNGDGHIDANELKLILFPPHDGDEDAPITHDVDADDPFFMTVQRMIDEVDEDGDGKIDFKEFKKAMKEDIDSGKWAFGGNDDEGAYGGLIGPKIVE